MIALFDDPTAEFERLPERIRNRIYRETPLARACWLWTGFLHYQGRAGEGYARVKWEGRNALAHRVTYEILVGPIEKGLVLDHVKERCHHRNCVRPDHLDPVTNYVNTMRGDAAAAFAAWKEEVPF